MENITIFDLINYTNINEIIKVDELNIDFLYKIFKNTDLMYSIILTTLFTAIWIAKEKPSKLSIFISYPISLLIRYKLYSVNFIFIDFIQLVCFAYGIINYLERNKIKVKII